VVLISSRAWVDPKAIVWPAILCQWKIVMTPSGTNGQPACSAVWTNCATVCYTIRDNADRIKYIAMSGTKVFSVVRLPEASGNEMCRKLWFCISYILVALGLNIL
jgi:hypothetical protein